MSLREEGAKYTYIHTHMQTYINTHIYTYMLAYTYKPNSKYVSNYIQL